ncbi:P-loop containing nucleoside triphosphate hydrolase protein [Blastocladiella britannica]|nr:P-loop containing nucleoside triphosphate hydrolase protein [Blastocladiella britannica]
MVAKKSKSKRSTCKQKYKIERKVREHHRKLRKEAKKNPNARSKVKKDPGIPNLWPFKQQLLDQIVESREREAAKAEEVKQRRAQLAKQQKATVAAAAGNSLLLTPPDQVRVYSDNSSRAQSQGTYYREFNKIMEKADVILQVLDARDPMGTRAKHIENMILESGTGKRVILILNKVDLVPKENVQEWLTYLRHEFPTIAFKASTQSQRRNLGQGNTSIEHATDAMLQSSESIGADALVKLLKNYSRSADLKTAVTVGVIGYPNVGKSSLINSLKRAKVCSTGATPGLTRVVQEIHLDKNIKLLDCPGIVFSPERPDASWKEKAAVMLRNCVRVESLEDPITPVELILTRASKPTLMMLYNIPSFNSVQEFLFLVGKARGKLRKGGVPDIEDAARAVLNDWNHGKILFYSVAPKRDLGGAAAIVDHFGSELDVDADLAKLATAAGSAGQYVAMPSVSDADLDAMAAAAIADADSDDEDAMDQDSDEEDSEEEDSDDAMDEDSDEEEDQLVVPEVTVNRKAVAAAAVAASAARRQVIMTEEESTVNPRLNQQRKKAAKQAKKMATKMESRLASTTVGGAVDIEMADAEDSTGNDSYDFGSFAWGAPATQQ